MKTVSAPEDYIKMEALNGAEYCATRQLFVYCISHFNQTKGVESSAIRLRDLSTGEEQIVTAGGSNESNPRFSPDGTLIAFISNAGGFGNQLWIMQLDDMTSHRVTSMRFGVMDPIWSPAGDKIAFLSTSPAGLSDELLTELPSSEGAAQYTLTRKKEPVVIEDFGYKMDGAGFIKAQYMHLWAVATDGTRPVHLTDGAHHAMHHNWTSDGKSLIFVSDRQSPSEQALRLDLFKISLQDAEITALTKDAWAVSYPIPFRPLCTPDGKYIISAFLDKNMIGDGLSETAYPHTRIHRIAADGSEDLNIFPTNEPHCFEASAFPYVSGAGRLYQKEQLSSDGQYVLFISGWKGQTNIYRMNLYGDQKIELLAGGKQVYAGIGKPQDGKMLVSMATPDQYGDYYLMDETTGALLEQLTFSNSFLDNQAISTPEELWIDTLDGESSVQGWVMPPQNRRQGEKYPAIIYIHGGPHPYYSYGFDFEMQCLAGAGFAVIYCNPRGSSSYGTTHLNLERAMDGSAYYDILQIVDEAVRRFDWIDASKIGVTGGSYGGYMTNYIATHSRRFKAFISQRSMSNDLISYASSDMQGVSKEYQNFEEFMVQKLKSSCVSYAERIDAPFLIMHGMEDMRTPVEGAHQLFVAIKDTHKDLPVKMILYPHTGHEIPTAMNQKLHYHNEMISWFAKYLKGDEQRG